MTIDGFENDETVARRARPPRFRPPSGRLRERRRRDARLPPCPGVRRLPARGRALCGPTRAQGRARGRAVRRVRRRRAAAYLGHGRPVPLPQQGGLPVCAGQEAARCAGRQGREGQGLARRPHPRGARPPREGAGAPRDTLRHVRRPLAPHRADRRVPRGERAGQAGDPGHPLPHAPLRHRALPRGCAQRLPAPRRGARGAHERRDAGDAGDERPGVPRLPRVLPRAGKALPRHHHRRAERERAPDERDPG